MKSSHLISLSIYVVCIIFGFNVGNILKQNEYIVPNPSSKPTLSTSIPALKNGQHNLLVVTTNNLGSSNQKLLSIWLVTYFLDNPSVTFLPIYPTLVNGTVKVDEELATNFAIVSTDGKHYLSKAFLDTLAVQNFWWSGYLIVDQQALSWGIETPPGELPNGPASRLTQDILYPVDNAENPITDFFRESQKFHEICQKIAEQSSSLNWESLHRLYPQHLSSNLDIELLINEWISMLSNNATPSCNFPLERVTP